MAKPKPEQALCVACMKRKTCVTKRETEAGIKYYDNFFYSEEHRGWLCKNCVNQLIRSGGTTEVPEILRKP